MSGEATLPERAKQLLDGANLVILTTLDADGAPHSTPVWALRDGEDIVMSTLTKRVKARNMARDPRASVVIVDPDNPVSYFSVNGAITLVPDAEKAVLHALSMLYLGTPYPIDEGPENERVTARLRPDRVIAQYEPAR